MRILIAEDDLTSRTVLIGVLKRGGHEVEETVERRGRPPGDAASRTPPRWRSSTG